MTISLVKLASYVAAAVLGAFLTGSYLSAKHSAKLSEVNAILADERAKHAEQVKRLSDTAADEASRALRIQRTLMAQLEEAEARHVRELNDQRAENEKLRTDLADGRRRLRVAAVCPEPHATDNASGVPGAAATTSLGDEAGPRLTDAAEQNYLTLRERIAEAVAMIGALQDYARVCQQAQDAPPSSE